MNRAVPWSVKGVDFDAREAAREAARRAGMSVGEWLNSVIADQAATMGVDVDDIDETGRLEAVTARLAQMSDRPLKRNLRRDDLAGSEGGVRRRRPTVSRDASRDSSRDPRDAFQARSRQDARYESHDRDEEFPRPGRDPYDEPAPYQRERAPDRGSERLLDETLRAFERGARQSSERTVEAISRVARRLEHIEEHIAAPQAAEASSPPANPTREAIDRLEARIESLARRREPDPSETSLRELEQKIAVMGARPEAKQKAIESPPISPDLARIEAKLNRLLESEHRPPARPPYAAPPAPLPRASIADAIAQITRRQQSLDSGIAAPSRRMSSALPIEPRAPRRDPGLDEIATMLKNAADIAARHEALHREHATSPGSSEAQAAQSDVLGRQIEEMSRSLKDLAPRGAVAAIDSAIRDLGQRIDASRQVGVQESILRPIEMLAAEVKRALADHSPREGIERLDRDIRALVAKVETTPPPALDGATLREIQGQTLAMRDLIARVSETPRGMDALERQIAKLSERVERMVVRGASGDDGLTIDRDIRDVRAELEQSLSGGVLKQLESKIERLSHKIDDAVSQSSAADQFDQLAQRIDKVQRTLAARSASTAIAEGAIDTSALERMMSDLAGKLERPAAADTRRLEEMLHNLSERLTHTGGAQSDTRFVDTLHQQIASLADKVDAAGQGRGDGRVLEQLRGELARFVDRFEAGQKSLDPRVALSLQQQMGLLVERLEKGDASAQMLVSLETTITELFHRIEDLKHVAVDAAESAARNSVLEAMQRMPNGSGAPPDSLTREIADLRALQDTADKRTHSTLTAVHETLEKVVDRLAVLEDDLADVRPESLASGPTPVFAKPSAAVEPPVTHAREPQPVRPRTAPSHHSAVPSLDAPIDELIEPGAGLPPSRRGEVAARAEPGAQTDYIAAARRLIQARASEAPPEKAAARGKGGILDGALSGARDRARAAHMAIAGGAGDDSSEAVPAVAKAVSGAAGSTSALSKVRGFVATRKRLVLIALIGLLAVAGSLQAMRMLRGPAARPEVVDLTGQKTSQLTPPPSSAPVAANAKNSDATSSSGSLLQAPADVSATSKFTPGGVDTTPVGAINAVKPTAANLREAAASGNPAAQFELATRYFEGKGVPRDAKLATQWFEKAALQNSAPAQYRLGSHFERGLGIDRDAKKAREWYLRSAEAGNIRAMHNLAVISSEGVDGKPDYAAAASWFRKAADHGVRDSQYNLAILYARGLGIEQNLQLSWMWFSLAANQGDEDAGKKRDDVASRLDPKGLAAAKAALEAFKPRSADKASNEVQTPPGGWDLPAPAEAARPASPPAPAAKPLPKGKVTSL